MSIIFPQVDENDWALKYGLVVETSQCQNCKKWFLRDIPFALKGYRGLMTKEHEGCGKNFISSIAVPVGDKLNDWRDLITKIVNE